MNILFLGGGRRVTLAELFIKRGHKIFAYERSYSVPIASVAEVIIGLRWLDRIIVQDLNGIIIDNKIDLMIPLQDEAVQLLSMNKDKFKCKCLVGSFKSSNVALDKQLLSYFINKYYPELHIDTTLITELNADESDNYFTSIAYPIIVKPVAGFNSRNITKVYDIIHARKLFKEIVKTKESYIFQPIIEGTEYTVDGYITIDNMFVDAVPRERMRVDGGEVVTSKTKDLPRLVNYTKNIGLDLGIVGPYNIQYIVNGDNIKIIEINARFGGGCTLSIEAGLDMPYFIESEYSNQPFSYTKGSWIKNLLMERAYRDFYYKCGY